MKNRYVDTGEWPKQFPYRAKALFAWEEIDGVDVCFFGMHVQEYGSDSSPPNQRRVYLAYLDSVHFFRPKQLRTAVYHEILLGYLDYAKQQGYSMAHIWACPPSEGDDYIFHCHPPEQKIPKPKRLQDWYKKMLDKGLNEKIVVDYKDILKQANEDNFKSPAELPYFEGDFWPNVIEKSLKELDLEKYTQSNTNPDDEEVKMESGEVESSIKAEGEQPQDEKGTSKKKQSANKKSSKKQNQRKSNVHNSRKTNSNQHSTAIANPARAWEAELTNKIYQTMEKHREVFFVIRLHSLVDAPKLKPIHDPDGMIECELMDGRDAFLTLAREKHYEFSSLRRAKWSSMCMLYELQTAQNNFGFTCNVCKAGISTRYHCTVCEDYDLCKNCYVTENHGHRMEKLESDEMGVGSGDDSGLGGSISGIAGASFNSSHSSASNSLSANDSKKLQIQRCIQGLLHSCKCRDANCRMQSCARLKKLISHSKQCKARQLGQNSCTVCRQLIALCCYHSKNCDDTQNKCPIPFCQNIKGRLKQQQLQARMRQQHLMQSRIRSMNITLGASAAPAAPTAVTTASPIASKQIPGKLDQAPQSQPQHQTAQPQQQQSAAPQTQIIQPHQSPGAMIMSTQDQAPAAGQVTLMPRISPAMNSGRPQQKIQQAQQRPRVPCSTPNQMSQPRMNQPPIQTQVQSTLASLVNGPSNVAGPQIQPQPSQPVNSMQFSSPQTNVSKMPYVVPNSMPATQQQPRQQIVANNSMIQSHIPQSNSNFRVNPPNYNAQTLQTAPTNTQNSRLQNILQQPATSQAMGSKGHQQYYMSQTQGNPNQMNQNMNMKQSMSQQPVHHVHSNNCCDTQPPIQTSATTDSVQYIKHSSQQTMGPIPNMMQPNMAPQQRIMRHPMNPQGGQVQGSVQPIQQQGHSNMAPRPMMQQQMGAQRIVSYPIGPQGQQLSQQTQQIPQQAMQQQHPQQQQQMGWQSFPQNQHNSMMGHSQQQQQGFIPQTQQMNQMGNPQPMMRGNVPMGNMRAPNMMRPVGVSRVATRYGHIGHVVNDQDMLAYPNQGNFINRNQQQQQELTPQEKLSHLIDKL